MDDLRYVVKSPRLGVIAAFRFAGDFIAWCSRQRAIKNAGIDWTVSIDGAANELLDDVYERLQ